MALALQNLKARPYCTKKGIRHLQEQYAYDLTVFLDYLNVENVRYNLKVLD